MPSHEHIQAIIRAWDILELVGSVPEGLTLHTIAGVRKLPKSTTHNILRTLVYKGLLAKTQHPVRYKLGPLMTGLRERRAKLNRNLLSLATPAAIRLARQLGTEVEVAQYVTGEVITRIRVYPGQAGSIKYLHAWRTPCYGTAVLFQAFMDESELRNYRHRHPMTASDAEYWKSYEMLNAFLASVRSEGYLSFAKSGVFRVAAAILDDTEAIRGMIRASTRMEKSVRPNLQQWVDLVRNAANSLSACMHPGQYQSTDYKVPVVS